LNSCLTSCPKDDPATPDKDEHAECRGDCYTDASYTANWDWEHLRQCVVDACPAGSDGNIDPTCLNQQITDPAKCYNQADKCWPHGTYTCASVWKCVNDCPANDSTCVVDCYHDGTYTAQYLYSEVIECIFSKCDSQCNSNDDQACNDCLNAQLNQGGACKTQYDACQNDTAVR
jgi:hypothetical protein